MGNQAKRYASRAPRAVRLAFDRSLLSYATIAPPWGARCRVCGEAIAAGAPMLARAWHVERAHVACGWFRADERAPHELRGAEARAGCWEWACPACGRDVVGAGAPPSGADLRCPSCRGGVGYERAARSGEGSEIMNAKIVDAKTGETLTGYPTRELLTELRCRDDGAAIWAVMTEQSAWEPATDGTVGARKVRVVDAERAWQRGDIVAELPARQYEDHDDCLSAARDDTARRLGLESWQLEATWDDERQRDAIIVKVVAKVAP